MPRFCSDSVASKPSRANIRSFPTKTSRSSITPAMPSPSTMTCFDKTLSLGIDTFSFRAAFKMADATGWDACSSMSNKCSKTSILDI